MSINSNGYAQVREGQAAPADIEALQREKDRAYWERNELVAALSKLSPAVLTRTDISGWGPEWHWCVYVDLPTGQVSWHVHESQLGSFDHLQRVDWVEWDGHDTDEKYRRLAALRVSA